MFSFIGGRSRKSVGGVAEADEGWSDVGGRAKTNENTNKKVSEVVGGVSENRYLPLDTGMSVEDGEEGVDDAASDSGTITPTPDPFLSHPPPPPSKIPVKAPTGKVTNIVKAIEQGETAEKFILTRPRTPDGPSAKLAAKRSQMEASVTPDPSPGRGHESKKTRTDSHDVPVRTSVTNIANGGEKDSPPHLAPSTPRRARWSAPHGTQTSPDYSSTPPRFVSPGHPAQRVTPQPSKPLPKSPAPEMDVDEVDEDDEARLFIGESLKQIGQLANAISVYQRLLPEGFPMEELLACSDAGLLACNLIGEAAVRHRLLGCSNCGAQVSRDQFIVGRPGTSLPHSNSNRQQPQHQHPASQPTADPTPAPPKDQGPSYSRAAKSPPNPSARPPPPTRTPPLNPFKRGNLQRDVVVLTDKVRVGAKNVWGEKWLDGVNAALKEGGVPSSVWVQATQISSGGNLILIAAPSTSAAELDGHVPLFAHLLPSFSRTCPDAPWDRFIVDKCALLNSQGSEYSQAELRAAIERYNPGIQLASDPYWLSPEETRRAPGKTESSIVLTFSAHDQFLLWRRTGIIFAGQQCLTRSYEERRRRRQCGKCWDYRHRTSVCPAPKPLCKDCGEDDHVEGEFLCLVEGCKGKEGCNHHPLKCVNCGGPHAADDTICPKRPSADRPVTKPSPSSSSAAPPAQTSSSPPQ